MKKSELKNILTLYLPTAPFVYVYMLQQVENNSDEFLKWINRSPDMRRVMRRKKLIRTKKASALLLVSYGSAVSILSAASYFLVSGLYPIAVGLVIVQPAAVILCLATISKIGTKLLEVKRTKDYEVAKDKLASIDAVKIVILGSYGKTTAKEILATTLGFSKKVAFTPGNMNVTISHARWIINSLRGDEEFIIFELGESKPGDIKKFCELIQPKYAILTGYAPNHIDSYGSVDALKADLESIQHFVSTENIFVEKQAAEVLKMKPDVNIYSNTQVLDWKIKNSAVTLEGTSFELKNNDSNVDLRSHLIGEHTVPILALAYALAIHFGVTPESARHGIANTVPFEHRMHAREINGAWLIDDTYNGNLEGIRAGLKLLKDIEAKRKIYVTPGLVEQGSETDAVHKEIGKLIAESSPDIVVFMENSVCNIMKKSLLDSGYTGEVRVETDPLSFYTNIQYELVGGDVVLMQNDWTDNYA